LRSDILAALLEVEACPCLIHGGALRLEEMPLFAWVSDAFMLADNAHILNRVVQ